MTKNTMKQFIKEKWLILAVSLIAIIAVSYNAIGFINKYQIRKISEIKMGAIAEMSKVFIETTRDCENTITINSKGETLTLVNVNCLKLADQPNKPVTRPQQEE